MQRPKGVVWAPLPVALFALFRVIFGIPFWSTFSCILEPKMGPEIGLKIVPKSLLLNFISGLFF